jgi:thiamine monophosphate kinase
VNISDEPQLLVARLVVVDMEEDFELLVKLPEDNKGEVQDQLCTLGFQILLQSRNCLPFAST